MRVADYIFDFLQQYGITDVFMVSGGGIMYLTDALGRNRNLRYWCNYNEQACAYAADGHARISGKPGVCLVTTGPGSTNAVSGVAEAFVDSTPLLVISGQVRTRIMADYAMQRQYGPQEINIEPMVRPVTKYAVTLTDPQEARYELEKCLYEATSGRPGPVWLNVPLDVQRAEIDPAALPAFPKPEPQGENTALSAALDLLEQRIRAAKRPLFIGGFGLTLSGGREAFAALVRESGIPAVLSMGGMDLLPEDHPGFIGRMGPNGQRRANFAVQNADLVVALGASLSISNIGFDLEVAPQAEKILVNIDEGDLRCAHQNIRHRVRADARAVAEGLLRRLRALPRSPAPEWLKACAEWKKRYSPLPLSLDPQPGFVDIYAFYHHLSAAMQPGDVIVGGNSLDGGSMLHQNFIAKPEQRMLISVCFGAMGTDLPLAFGASVAAKDARTVLVTGDGSFLFNVQELMSVGFSKRNLKIFVINNDGYQCIRNTQDNYFSGLYVGADKGSGVANPDFAALAAAFGIGYDRLQQNEDIPATLAAMFRDDGPRLCEVRISRTQPHYRLGSMTMPDGSRVPRPLEDMEPLLPREELEENMGLFSTGAGK